ncbi:MAG: hypothetical protein Q8M76_19700, partial [Spirochaetaceae bacterium]|nr:hypothetical protein [Spirochaetaceae bacterium]
SESITLSMESLRALGSWAADCAERALSLYERRPDSDSRPRAAIEGIRAFAAGGKRTAHLRSLALKAFAAAREAGDPAGETGIETRGLAPGESLELEGLVIDAVPAYNLKAGALGINAHDKKEGYLAYRFEFGGMSSFHTGDFDDVREFAAKEYIYQVGSSYSSQVL